MLKNLFIKQVGWTIIVLTISYLGLVFFPISASSEQLSFAQRWSNWDGTAYLRIAEKGYGVLDADYSFFPFYPIMIRVVSYLAFGNYSLSVLTVSWFSLFFALFFLYKLIRMDFSKSVAEKTVKYLIIFPFSFFFIAGYTESIYLFLTVAAFYFFRKSLYVKSSFSGMLATATRVTGIAIFPALLLETLKDRYPLKKKKNICLVDYSTWSSWLYGIFIFRKRKSILFRSSSQLIF